MGMKITTQQYLAMVGKKRLSKDDEARIANGLDPVETEDRVQERVVNLLERMKDYGHVVAFTSVPNSTRTPYHSVRAKNTRLGLRAGFPDLVVVTKRPNGELRLLFLELKREKGGTVSKEQDAWIRLLCAVSKSVTAKVARGYSEARSAVFDACGLPDFEKG